MFLHPRTKLRCAIICSLALLSAGKGAAYSVLSHEAIVDALWDVQIKPLLLARYPSTTPEELKKAHGFAYGGAIIQDLGYYPHGSEQFSDLTHYVRTGDFILALLKESQDVNELAFALGALSHYVSDLDGHRFATNVGEPLLYPKLQRKFGNVITYEDNPAGHLKTEFGFDVLEVAKGNFAPQAYHDFIGFYVAKDVLARGFCDTYGLELKDLFKDFDRAIESYRRAVSKTIPMATRVAWAERQKDIQQSIPGMTRQRFVYIMRRSSYEREWGKQYDRPTGRERFLAFIVKLLPPMGPLKALRFKMPTPPVEKLFMESFDRAAKQYGGTLDNTSAKSLALENRNYDVGVTTPAGVYRLDDAAHAFWLDMLAKKDFSTVSPAIAAELLSYYSDLNAPIETKKHPEQWKRLRAELEALKAKQTAEIAAAGQQ
ncbi:MAG: zinc dependent phospholipase C family protein [Acidobacteriaceae bacterium]|nr:zinc dependent phospholipase C family protein [Acidobacteriaceae bacterium]